MEERESSCFLLIGRRGKSLKREASKRVKLATQVCLFSPLFCLFLLLFVVLLGLKLDKEMESWTLTFLPLFLFFLSLLSLSISRCVLSFKGVRVKDSFDSPKLLLLFSGGVLSTLLFSLFAFLCVERKSVSGVGWNFAFLPLELYSALVGGLSVYGVVKNKEWTEKAVAAYFAAILFSLFSFFLCLHLKLQNLLFSSWTVTLTPLWLLFSLPLLGSSLSCLLVLWKKEGMSCSKLFDCSRQDNAEGFLFGLVGLLSAALLLPFFLMSVMIVSIVNGSSTKNFSSSFIPLEIFLFLSFLLSIYTSAKRCKSIVAQ